jgi:dTDP-4-dehydrorhamnose reductase
MLGSAVIAQLSRSELDISEASRTQGFQFDAERDSCEDLFLAAGLTSQDYVVNCVGLTKTHISEADPLTVERAVRLNTLFPIALARVAEMSGVRVIQVATDCVFSGQDGGYVEANAHDAHDCYGKSKSMGEVRSENVLHLRCSLVGPELDGRKSLFFEWVRALDKGAIVDGYFDHKWNGLTSQAFGAIVSGIIGNDIFISGVQHLVPADSMTKFELLKMELDLLGRDDVTVKRAITGNRVDRTLNTINPDQNELMFKLGGYHVRPTIREMMEQLPWAELRVK